jgi:hypothetical protein
MGMSGEGFELFWEVTDWNPTIVFKLNEAMDSKHRGVFCRIFRYQGKFRAKNLPLNKGEVYGVLEVSALKTGLRAGSCCYALLTLDDWTPLVEARQLDKGHWVINLTQSIFEDGTLTVPFRRPGTEETIYSSIELLEIFHGPPELFCKQGAKNVKVGGPLIGCIEPRPRVENMAHDWVGLLPIPSISPLRRNAKLMISAKWNKSEHFRLQIFDLSSLSRLPTKIDILPSKHVIGRGTAFIALLNNFTKPFFDRGLPVYFKAVEADGVEVSCGTVRSTLERPDKTQPVFSGPIGLLESVQIAATTTNPTVAFRVFPLSVLKPKLFKYPTADGLIHIRGTGQQFEYGYSPQALRELNDGALYKYWRKKLNF